MSRLHQGYTINIVLLFVQLRSQTSHTSHTCPTVLRDFWTMLLAGKKRPGHFNVIQGTCTSNLHPPHPKAFMPDIHHHISDRVE